MLLKLQTAKWYVLTVPANTVRQAHIRSVFENMDIIFVNGGVEKNKHKSVSLGFSRIVDHALTNMDNSLPFQPFVFCEDDVSLLTDIPESIEIPKDADLLYIGLSSYGMVDGKAKTETYYTNIDTDLVKVQNMLATHGIVVCSPRGALALQRAMFESYFTEICSDIYLAYSQPYINAYALKVPIVYQDMAYGGIEHETRIWIDDSDPENVYTSLSTYNSTCASVLSCSHFLSS